MSGLKPFRFIPEDISQWTRWFNIQDIPDEFSIVTNSKTFQSQNIAIVILESVEVDNDYVVLIDSGVNETFWTTGKKTTEFTLNSSNASSTATVNWVLMR